MPPRCLWYIYHSCDSISKGRPRLGRHLEPLYWPIMASLAIDKPRSGENLGAMLRRNSQKILAFRTSSPHRASPITLDGVRSLKDLQTSKGYVVGLSTSFGPNASGNLSILTQSGNAAIIFDVSVVPNTLLNPQAPRQMVRSVRRPTWSRLEL
jgi:hypothetical protein